mmetsp:Transcript_82870/g.222260  ORF Transcript_82870/g.222260 Transcript_82870/m.222260 type:complete len:219 (-) Transcript_82870:390-1046(-)
MLPPSLSPSFLPPSDPSTQLRLSAAGGQPGVDEAERLYLSGCGLLRTICRGEVGDLSRTISALTGLYHSASIKGQKPSANCDEFIAYRMLYGMREENNVLESVTVMLAQLPAATRRAPDVAFATEVGQALLCNDYTTFFRLYEKAPKMTGYIMDFFVDRVRKSALQTFLRSHGPTVDVDHFKRLLCFAKRKDCFRFLREAGVVFTEDKRAVDTKASRA